MASSYTAAVGLLRSPSPVLTGEVTVFVTEGTALVTLASGIQLLVPKSSLSELFIPHEHQEPPSVLDARRALAHFGEQGTKFGLRNRQDDEEKPKEEEKPPHTEPIPVPVPPAPPAPVVPDPTPVPTPDPAPVS